MTVEEGVSDRLCGFIAQTRWEALDERVRDATAAALLDAVGVIQAASGMSAEAQPFLDLARQGGAGPSRVLGTDIAAQPQLAALANGALSHALDYEDAFDAAPSHPNAAFVPAGVALAQALSAQGRPVSGPHFLTAMAIGCDVAWRIGLSITRPMEAQGWYPPPIWGAFGATAGTARLLGLDARRTRDALSLTFCQLGMPGEIKYSAGTVIRAVREAFPAQTALVAARLALSGAVTGFERPLEGEAGFYRLYAAGHYDPARLFADLGKRFHIADLSFKPWPSCRGTHAFIELAGGLVAEHRLDWREIDAIEVEVDEVHEMLVAPLARKQAPAVAIDAKFSIPFTLALSLVRGRVTLDDFEPDSLTAPEILALAARVTPVPAEPGAWPRGLGGGVRIVMRDGRRVSARARDAVGSPDRPLSRAQLVDKFVDCVGRAARPKPADEARKLATAILGLADCADVGALLSS